jgi:hypothetical protein
MSNIGTQYQSNAREHNPVSCAAPVGAGLGALFVSRFAMKNSTARWLFSRLFDASKLSPLENDVIHKAAYQTLETSGLRSKEVTIIKLPPKRNILSIEQIKNLSASELEIMRHTNPMLLINAKIAKFMGMPYTESYMKRVLIKEAGKTEFWMGVKKDVDKFPIKFVRKWLNRKIEKQIDCMHDVRKGDNAAYAFITNKIFMPQKGLFFAVFHEMGHAMTQNFGTITKYIERASIPAKFLPIIIGLFAIFTRTKQATKEKELSSTDKFTNFVRNNAGKLAFLSFTPVLISEFFASYRGEKLAKKVLSPDLMKRMGKFHKLAFSTYLASGLIGGAATAFAVKVKDYVYIKRQRKRHQT